MLLVWPDEDAVFPLVHAERYAAALGNGTLVAVGDSYSLTPEDQPAALAEAITAFCSN